MKWCLTNEMQLTVGGVIAPSVLPLVIMQLHTLEGIAQAGILIRG